MNLEVPAMHCATAARLFKNIPASFQTVRSQNSNSCLMAHMHLGLIFLEQASYRSSLHFKDSSEFEHTVKSCGIAALSRTHVVIRRVDYDPGQFSFSMCQWSAGG